MENVWVVFESNFKCSGRPSNLVGIFSTEGKACIAAEEAGHGSVVFPLKVDQVIGERTFVYEH